MESKEYKLLEKLYFERIGGTDKELEACHIIQDELKQLGLESYIEDFDVVTNHVSKVSLEVLKPYQKTYEATAYMGCVNTQGLVGELCYFESDNAVSKKQVCGKIALVNGYLGMKTFKAITEAKAVGFITYNGNIDREENDLDPRELRESLQEFGNLPGVNIRVEDAMEMVAKGASEVRIVVEQTIEKVSSHNLICDITGESEDMIVCTAHYDSVPHSKGAYDNATGSVCLYGLAKELKDKKLAHNLRLIWCGSEERGLLGSKAYVAAHQEEMENIKLCVNVDMIGSIMGRRIAVCTSDMSLVHYMDYFGKIKGFPIEVSQGVYSSDSTPFADNGVPAVSFARITSPGTGEIHSRYDVMEHLSESMLLQDTSFICEFVSEMANSFVIPIPKEIPDNMKEEIDKYYGRDLKKKEEEDKKA
ncbi:M28 family metallopeptidase [Traorella massiliensis]|uniref:M28 family metallopeptidase n=1 Tax=Traorella massiliensis TaxID=1903263 RepID=UPI002354704F|nr:M28 family metallopeptidase [Traorella massiliensis]